MSNSSVFCLMNLCESKSGVSAMLGGMELDGERVVWVGVMLTWDA